MGRIAVEKMRRMVWNGIGPEVGFYEASFQALAGAHDTLCTSAELRSTRLDKQIIHALDSTAQGDPRREQAASQLILSQKLPHRVLHHQSYLKDIDVAFSLVSCRMEMLSNLIPKTQ